MKKIMFIALFLVFALSLSVSGVGELAISDLASVTADPATSAEGSFTITNNGGENYSVTFTMGDLAGPHDATIPGTAVSFEPATLDLTVGEVATVNFTVAVPAAQTADQYFAVLKAEHNATVSTIGLFNLVVSKMHDATVSATSPSIVQGQSGSMDITFTNLGNDDILWAELSVDAFTDGTNTLSFNEVVPTHVNLWFDTTAGLTFTFDVPASQPAGTYTSTVTLTKDSFVRTAPLTVVVTQAAALQTALTMPSQVILPLSDTNESVSRTFIVTNSGDVTITGISLTTDAAQTTLSGMPTSLAAGAQATVTVTTFIPATASRGEKVLGTITLTSDQLTKTATLRQNVRSLLHIKKLRLRIGSETDSITEDGDKFKEDALPNDRFTLSVEVENMFTDDEDIDIDDIEIYVVFEGVGEDGDDIEGDADDFDLKEDSKKTVSIDWDDDVIDWEAESGEHILTVTVEGEDENGVIQRDEMTVRVDVDRDHGEDFIFTRVDLADESVEAGDTVRLNIEARSIGEDDNDEVKLLITSSDLELDIEEEFEFGAYNDYNCDAIEDPDDGCNQFDFTARFVVPRDLADGSYDIEVILVYGNREKVADSTRITIDVEGRASSSSSSSSSSNSGSSDSGSSSTGTTTDSGESEFIVQLANGGVFGEGGLATAAPPTKITDVTETSFNDSPLYMALLVLASLAVLGGVIALAGSVARKPEEPEGFDFDTSDEGV